MRRYYFGSYGLVRGYGPLATTYARADWSVRQDGREQRENGGSSDRIACVVDADTGLCWWLDGDEDAWDERDLYPVRTTSGTQARYQREALTAFELVFFGPREMAGFY